MTNETHKPVKNPKTRVVNKDEAILGFEYPFGGQELHIELVLHRELLNQVLERMDRYVEE